MNFTVSSLFASLVFGAFGIYFLKEGKRNGNFYRVIIGALMLIYPYFVEKPVLEWGIGAVLFGLGMYFKE